MQRTLFKTLALVGALALTACQTMWDVKEGDYVLHVRDFGNLMKKYRFFGGKHEAINGFAVPSIYPNDIWVKYDKLCATTIHEIRHLNEPNWHE